jgi:prepilin-type N-terminal cleavage/methylation domain-containing protein
MRKAFSIIEMVFVIVIISILASFIIPSFMNNKNEATSLKLKSTILAIQNGILTYHSKSILENKNIYPEKLDDVDTQNANQFLFIGYDDFVLFTNPIISTQHSNPQSGHWSKESKNIYHYWTNTTKSIRFTYSSSSGKFTCDYSLSDCQKIYK